MFYEYGKTCVRSDCDASSLKNLFLGFQTILPRVKFPIFFFKLGTA